MKMYCQKCGFKIEFLAKDKPKFCCSCGASLNPSQSKAVTLVEPNEEVEEDEEEDVLQVPDISKLDVDVVTYSNKGESLASVIGTADNHDPKIYQSQSESLSQEEFRKQFKKEAGTLRKPSSPSSTNEK